MSQQPQWGQQPPPRKPGFWSWFDSRTPVVKIILLCGAFVAVFLFLLSVSAALGIGDSSTPSSLTPFATSGQAAVMSSPVVTTGPSPTPIPTQKPKPALAPTHAPQPTQPPATPTPCPGINCNPWGYNFNPGNLIYYPPATFCNYFACITSFVEPDDPGDGYVVECSDSMFSQSGGERGACSYHGGVLRPLYSH